MTKAFTCLHILPFDINHTTAVAELEASNNIHNGEGKEQVLFSRFLWFVKTVTLVHVITLIYFVAFLDYALVVIVRILA